MRSAEVASATTPVTRTVHRLTSVNDVPAMKVIDSVKHLLDRLGGILLRKLALLADPVEELAARGQLGDNVVLVLRQMFSDPG